MLEGMHVVCERKGIPKQLEMEPVKPSNKLRVKCSSEDEQHPSCPHGPCLLFYHDDISDGYFACSCFRNKRDCNVHIPFNELNSKHLNRRYDIPKEQYRLIREKVKRELKKSEQYICYCHNCNTVLLLRETTNHNKSHEIAKLAIDVNNKRFKADPTAFLRPLQNDKAQAQYFFDAKALNFFGQCFSNIAITKVVCIGAPKLHGYLTRNYEKLNIKSFLLDIDHRFYYFYDDDNFAWYNMCNNHFFDESQKKEFLQFLEADSNDRILLFTDPPFGCRTEPIANTMRQLTRLYNSINKLPHQPLPMFWIFPYFSASYIRNDMPEMEMCDYKVNYTNHLAYSDSGDKGNRKLGSPVRLFTNVPLVFLKLPVEEGYKYCAHCLRYTALENRHCEICRTCPSKNGSKYRHCDQCGICVKPNYVHCTNCRRCTQIEGHNCEEYKRKQRCWICSQVGHIERECDAWRNVCKKFVLSLPKNQIEKQIRCLLCGAVGHNERFCEIRNKYIQEITFLGETEIRFV